MKTNRYFGNRAFYGRMLAVTGPILLQNVITNFVSLLDNVMVGQVGPEPMSGVAIVNQLLFVFNLCIFGGLSGPGIFSAQFYGKGDLEGVRHAMRSKLYLGLGFAVLCGAVLIGFGSDLIMLFLHEGSDALDLTLTLRCGQDYLGVMLLQLLPFAVTQAYSGTLRETGETLLPMKAGFAAVFINLALNYVLIFGKLGAPALGVVGAAIATVCARFAECAIVIVWTHTHRQRCPFICGIYRSLRVPRSLLKQIAKMTVPLLGNELLWSLGITTLSQCYSMRGLEVVSASNIASTVTDLFICISLSTGTAIAIIIGQLLGAGEPERAVDEDRKLVVFSVLLNVGVGLVMALVAPLIPRFYNTTEAARAIASRMLLISAAVLPANAFTTAVYFTLRCGGKTLITFLFDSCFNCVITVPLALILSRCTALPILPMFFCVQMMDVVKCIFGFILLRSRKWVNNLVGS